MAIVRAKYAGKKHSALIPCAGRLPKIPDSVVIEIGKPHEPHSAWKCGTDVVWPVLKIIEPAGVTLTDHRFVVCRHEIVAGD
jgi:hypothetical protein